jgi:hypothetical protein
MALTINPAVSGTRRKWILHSLGFLAGAFAGSLVALLLVLIIVAAASLLVPTAAIVAVSVSVILWAALHDLGVPLPLPYRSQQVPEWLRNVLPPGAVATAFGFQLGVGFLTLFTYSTHLAILVALPFLSSLGSMVAVIAIFAIGKTIVLAATLGTTSTQELLPRFDSSRRRMHALRLTTATASILVAAALIATS